MIVIQNATVVRVIPTTQKDRETGEIKNIHQADLLHTTSDHPAAKMELITIKLKEQAQADAFGKAQGQVVNCPVQVWASGDMSGFWLEKGVLPVVQGAAKLKAAA